MSQNTQAILWSLLATAIYALVACMAKMATQDYHVLQILFFRQIAVLATTVPSLARNLPGALQTRQPGLHMIRLACSFAALSLGIWAVQELPLTTATTLRFTGIFFVAMLATLFLKETLGPHRISAILLGFAGVLVVMRPDVTGLASGHSLIAIGSALGGAGAAICVRRLSQQDSTATLLAYQAIFIGLLSGLPMLWLWKTPSVMDAVFMLTMGFLSSTGQWIGIKAIRMGDASVVKSAEYSSILYATILGFAVFGEIPDRYTLAGAGLIILSALYMIHRESITKKALNANASGR